MDTWNDLVLLNVNVWWASTPCGLYLEMPFIDYQITYDLMLTMHCLGYERISSHQIGSTISPLQQDWQERMFNVRMQFLNSLLGILAYWNFIFLNSVHVSMSWVLVIEGDNICLSKLLDWDCYWKILSFVAQVSLYIGVLDIQYWWISTNVTNFYKVYFLLLVYTCFVIILDLCASLSSKMYRSFLQDVHIFV